MVCTTHNFRNWDFEDGLCNLSGSVSHVLREREVNNDLPVAICPRSGQVQPNMCPRDPTTNESPVAQADLAV
jgi:hypothetical protein